MTEKSRFFSALLNFGSAQALGLLASFISFPILARILSVSEYGVLGLCNTTLLFGCAIAKMGFQNSVVRFYHDYREQKRLDTFYATFLWGGGGISLLVSFALIPVSLFIAPQGFRGVLLFVIPLVFAQALFSTVTNFLRSEERSAACAVSSLVIRYIGTFGGVALVYYAGLGLVGLFAAQIFIYVIVSGYFLNQYGKNYSFRYGKFSSITFSDAARYGVPLLIFEMSSIVLAFSDRYFINAYTGTEQLGIYTAVYAICLYIADLIRQPLQQAVMPVYLRVWNESGPEKTVEFIREVIGYVFLVILPLFALCVALGEDLVVLLASEKYAPGAVIIPWVLGSCLLYALQPLIGAGFYIKKQTKLFSSIIFVGATLNILMNLFLIPKFGITAAAWSTTASYLLVLTLMTFTSKKLIVIRIPILRVFLYGLFSIVLFCIVIFLKNYPIIHRIGLGLFGYLIMVFLFERKLILDLSNFLRDKYNALRQI